MSPPDQGFRYLGERLRYGGSFVKLATATFLDPSGYTFERDVVRHPGAVTVVGLLDDDRVVMVRQYRGSVDRVVLELPAGKLDIPGEVTDVAAQRELIEETGYRAATITELGKFFNSPGFTDEETTCFLAEGLEHVGRDLQGIEEEHMTIEEVPLSSVHKLQQSGELIDGKSLIGLFLAERFLAERRGGS